MANTKLRLKEVALFGILGALTFGAKMVMSWLPNIEPVSLFVMVYAVVFGRKCLYPIYVYVALELLCFGLHLWSINYLYVWAVLALSAWLLRKMADALPWAILSAVFGLLFGALCAPVQIAVGGVGFAFSWWISGIPYDILHCVGNFFMALVLFLPLRRLLTGLYARISQ